MQFLVIGKYTEPGTLLPEDRMPTLINDRVLPALETLAQWEEKGETVKAGGIFAGQRVGAFFLEAESGEEVGQLLSSLPFWHDVTWDVTPMQSFRSTIERETHVLEQAQAGAA
ncbi:MULTISPECIES: hypothetical protein [Streptomyces]|jgi:hypothetical protein|uniref:hypothetical protein n=1 Tax=Streptomyces TaxID=1883 RepID=UPI0033A83213